MMRRARITAFLMALAAVAGVAIADMALVGSALADGPPVDGEIYFQPAATDMMERMTGFTTYLLVIMTAIVIIVMGLLLYVMVRFNRRANPTPSKTSHNTMIEVIWTLVPVIILVFVVVPSFRILFDQLNYPEADMTIKAIGKQWYWSYEYPDADGLAFDSFLVEDKDLKPGQPRLLTVDNPIYVPVNKTIRLEVIGGDVIHSFAMPAMGLKLDAIPGRLNETWFKPTRTGVFYGQCSELCGAKHAFMPIELHVVSDEDYAAWLTQAKTQFGAAEPAQKVAQLDPAAE